MNMQPFDPKANPQARTPAYKSLFFFRGKRGRKRNPPRPGREPSPDLFFFFFFFFYRVGEADSPQPGCHPPTRQSVQPPGIFPVGVRKFRLVRSLPLRARLFRGSVSQENSLRNSHSGFSWFFTSVFTLLNQLLRPHRTARWPSPSRRSSSTFPSPETSVFLFVPAKDMRSFTAFPSLLLVNGMDLKTCTPLGCHNTNGPPPRFGSVPRSSGPATQTPSPGSSSPQR